MSDINTDLILEKGFYNHSQKSDYLKVKQYIIIKKEGKRCLLLRFFNESELLINGMEIILTQKDFKRKVIDSTVVKMDGIKVRPGETYTPDEGIVISDKCADFTVTLKSFCCGEYVYTEVGGAFIPGYDPGKNSRRYMRRGEISVKKRNITSSRISAVAAIILLAVFVLIGVSLSVSFLGDISPVPLLRIMGNI